MKELIQPLFYHSTIGMQFNIGDKGNEIYINDDSNDLFVNSDYIQACLERSLNIYHSLKSKPDLLVIEGHLYKDETMESFILSIVSTTDLPQPTEIKSELIHNQLAFYYASII